MPEKIIINGIVNEPLEIELNSSIYGGGEAEIYPLPRNDYLLKRYRDKLLTETRKEKVLDFCSRYETFKSFLKIGQYALPEAPAIEVTNDNIVGFAMRNMGKLPQILSFKFDDNDFQTYKGFKLNDYGAIELIYNMYESLMQLHRANIILGDLNPTNILYDCDKKCPVFVDIDSAQLGKYSCYAYTQDYTDPIVEESGKNTDGSYVYNSNSDYFSLALICYELFIGANPYFFSTKPPEFPEVQKMNRRCLINFLEDKNYANSIGMEFSFSHPINKKHIDRLKILESKDKVLYKYFSDTFCRDKRCNLLTQLPKDDKRNPCYTMYNKKKGPVKTIKEVLSENLFTDNQDDNLNDQNKFNVIDQSGMIDFLKYFKKEKIYNINAKEMPNDTKAFMMFVDNLGLDYNNLITRGT